MLKEREDYCTECREIVEYQLKKVPYKKSIRNKEYEFEITMAVCENCGEEVDIPGLLDRNAMEIDRQYRRAENIVQISDIQKLMEIYRIGKAPLSLSLGFGEITITRYLLGQMPSKEYSDIIRKAIERPQFMIEKLQENKEIIGETAYKKAMKAAQELVSLFKVSDKLLLTISYIFERAGEVTPLALQKLLYFIQGLYMVHYNKALYSEDCEAWVHGPVYEMVYDMFKSFKFNPIEDERFAVFKNRFHELSEEERQTIDLVVESFGMYSGKVLEQVTHSETPWCEARKNCLPGEISHEIITKETIKDYFQSVAEKYDITTVEGIREYIREHIG